MNRRRPETSAYMTGMRSVPSFPLERQQKGQNSLDSVTQEFTTQTAKTHCINHFLLPWQLPVKLAFSFHTPLIIDAVKDRLRQPPRGQSQHACNGSVASLGFLCLWPCDKVCGWALRSLLSAIHHENPHPWPSLYQIRHTGVRRWKRNGAHKNQITVTLRAGTIFLSKRWPLQCRGRWVPSPHLSSHWNWEMELASLLGPSSPQDRFGKLWEQQ